MSKVKCSIVKKSAAGNKAQAQQVMKAGGNVKAVGDAVVIQDNEDGTFTVFGVNMAGNMVDISGVASITAASSDTSLLSIGTITGATVAFSGVKPGHVDIDIDATWNDGSVGPFELALPADVTSSPVRGIVVDLGTPTPRP